MPTPAAGSLQVEQVLDDLIARLSKQTQTKDIRIALIEARRLRNLTARWSAIPPPEDARREMLTKVMDLVAVAKGERRSAASSPSVSGAHALVRRALPTPFPPPSIDPVATARAPLPPALPNLHPDAGPRAPVAAPIISSEPPPSDAATTQRQPSSPELAPEPDWQSLARRRFSPMPSTPPPAPQRSAERTPTRPSTPSARGSHPALELDIPPLKKRASAPPEPSPTSTSGAHRVPSIPPPPAPHATSVAPASAGVPGAGRQLRAKVAEGITLVRPDAAPWRPYPNVDGATIKLLFRDPATGVYTALVRLDAGAELPAHRHAGTEEMYVVEGVATMGEDEMCAGDYCRAQEGSVHNRIKSAVGCTFYLTGSEHDEVLPD